MTKPHKDNGLDNFYDELFSTSHAVFLLIDPSDGKIVDANEAAIKYYGYSKEEITSLHISDINTLSPEALKAEMSRAEAKKRVCFLFKHKLKSGEIRDVEVYSGPVHVNGKECLFSIVHDVTFRTQTEKALKESENRYRQLIDNSNDAIFIADGTTGILVDANEVASRLIKRPVSEIIGMHQTQLHPPEELENYAKIFSDYVKDPKGVLVGIWVIDSDGKKIPVSINSKVYLVDGKPFVQGVFRDTSESQAIEDALAASERRFREFIHFAPDGIIVIDNNADIIIVNKQAELSFGYSEGELLGSSIDILVPNEHRQFHSEQCAIFRKDASRREMGGGLRLTGRRKDGSHVPVEVSLGPVDTVDGQITLVMVRDISARVKIEEAFRDERDKAQMYLEIAAVTIIALDMDGNVVTINRKGCEILGLESDQVVGKNWFDNFIPESERSLKKIEFSEIMHEEIPLPTSCDGLVLTYSGDVLEFNWRSSFLRDGKGNIVHLLRSGEDVTESNREKNEIITRSRQLGFLSKISRDVNAEHDISKIRRMIAAAAAEFTASKIAGVSRMSGDEVIFDELTIDQKNVTSELKFSSTEGASGFAIKNKTAYFINDTLNDPLADKVIAKKMGIDQMIIVPIIGKRQDIQGTIEVGISLKGAYTDNDQAILENLAEIASISIENAILLENIRAKEEQLKVIVTRLNAILDASPLAITVLDIDRNISLWNRQAVDMFGYSEAEVIGKKALFVSDDLKDEHLRMLEKVASGKTVSNIVTKRSKKDGTLLDVSVSMAPTYDSSGSVSEFVTMMADISDQRALESQFMHAQKMEAIGRLAGGIAHDFNNLLTAMIGNAELLMMDLSPEDPRYKEAEVIKTTGDKAAKLTKQLLTVSKSQVIQAKELNLNEVVQSMAIVLDRIIGDDVKQTLVLAPDLKPIFGDASQVEQIILNLAVNARDAMPNGGEIAIHTKNFYAGEEYIRLNPLAQRGNYICLEIRDNGPGIPEDIKDNIFEPFFTTRKSGTGLGLSTVYGIVSQLGGNISVSSNPGSGTAFTILLPVFEDVDNIVALDHELKRDDLKGNETVWMVEDEPSLRKLYETVLEGLNYRVKTFSSLSQLLESFNEERSCPNILITDSILAGKEGSQVLENMKKDCPEIKLLYTSGYSLEQYHERGLQISDSVYLRKPYTPVMLALKIRELLS